MPAIFCTKKGGDDVGVAVANHRHHNEPRRDILRVADPFCHITDAIANDLSENQKVENGGDHRRKKRLRPDANEAVKLLRQNGVKRGPIISIHHNPYLKRLIIFLRHPQEEFL